MKKFLSIVAVLSLVFSPITPAFAADANWTGSVANDLWSTVGNWSAAPVPGTGNTATFNGVSLGGTTIDLGAGVTIGNVSFTGAAAAAYTIGTGGAQQLTLDAGGAITMASNVVNNQVIASETLLAGAATFSNDAVAVNTLSFSGNVTGTSAAAQTLTLTGANTDNNYITGIISDGAGGGTLAISKTGLGTWDLFGVNTYTGGTTISAGTLIASASASALGAGTLTMSGGKLQLADNASLNFGRNTTVTANSEIDSGRFAGAGAGSTQTLGTLSIGAFTLTVGLGDALTTSGTQGLTFGAVTLTGDAGITVTSTHGAAAEGLLTLGTVDSSNATDRAFTITGGTDDVTVGVMGNIFDLASVTITGNDITLANIGGAASGVTGATAITAADDGADAGSITLTGTTYNTAGTQAYDAGAAGNLINLNGGATTTFTTTADNVTFTGTTTLGNGSDLSVTTAGTAPGSGNITMGTIRGTSVENVTLNAGSANIAVGSIGNVAAGEIMQVTFTGATITLNGANITTDDNGVLRGDILMTGNVVLGTGVTIDTSALNTLDSGNLQITGATSASAGGQNLTINTASGNRTGGTVTLGALSNAGGAYVNNLSITTTGTGGAFGSGGISLQATQTDGTQNYDTAGAGGAANGTVTLNGDLTTSNDNITFAANTPVTLGAAVTITSGTGNTTLRNVNTAGYLLTMSNTGASASEIAGVMSGAGGLTKNGTGTLTLSGANTYTGATTINGGTLDLTGSLADTGAVNLANVAGAIFKLNGNETIGSLSGGGTTGGNVDLNGANTLTVGDANNTTYSGVISGALGAIVKEGTGTLTFANANTYTGTTTINTGTLAYSNSVSSASSHVNNAALTVGLNTLTLAAGESYTQNAASTLNVTIDGASFGSINTAAGGGTAAVIAAGSTVNVTVGSQYIANGATYTIVNTGATGIGAVPTTITDNSYVLNFTGPTNALTDLVLTAVRANAYNTVVTGGNNQAAASALEQAGKNGATGDMATVLNTLDSMSSAAEINTAIGTMTPDVSSGAAESSRSIAANSLTMISNRLGGARSGVEAASGVSSGDAGNGVGVWIQGLGSNAKQDERKGIQGYSANIFGTTIGADKVLDNHYRAGFAGGYGWAGVHSKQPGSPSDDINSFQATIYGSYDSLDLNKARAAGKKSYEAVRTQVEDSWYVDGMVSFAQNNYDSRREVWLTPTNKRVAKADHYGQQYSTNFEVGYKFVFEETKNLEVTPFASLGYNYLYMNSYKEKGANALDLSVQGEGFHQLEQGLGTKLAYPIVCKKTGTWIPSAKAAWLYDYIGDRFETDASFAGGGGSFTTKGAKPAKNGMLFGAELAFLNKGNVTVTGNWDIELKNQYMSNTYYGTVRYDF